MANTTETVAGVQMIALSEIRHDQNVRQELLAEEVDALVQSIALLGQLIPVSVRPDTESAGYLLYLQQAVIRSMGDHRWSLPSVPEGAAASTSDNPGCQRMSFLRA